MKIFVRDKAFYKTFFPLLAVITLQQLTTLAVSLADNVMLGRYSELALSGATITNQLFFFLQQLVAGFGMGVVVLGSQYWGKRETEPIKKIIALGLLISFAAGFIFFAVTLVFPKGALGLLTNDSAVIGEAYSYLKTTCWTFLMFSLSSTLLYSLQSVETAFIGTVMSLSTLVVKLFLNYCLIYGNLGFGEMGIQGAAISTFVSRIIELMIILSYVLLADKKIKLRLKDLILIDFTYLKDFFKVCFPLVVSGAMWGFAQTVQMAILGHMSASVIAANSIAVTTANIIAVAGLSCASAASVTIGKTIGEKRLHMIKPYTVTLQWIFLIIGLVSGAVLFIVKDLIIDFYAISSETAVLTRHFLLVLCVTTIGTCYEYPVASGIIAGGGDTKYPAIVENLFTWLFVIPASALSAFVFRWPPLVTFMWMKADQILKCLPNGIRCNRYKWVRQLTRDK
ncbi:MAG: MATE family efflux transporter [Papillibacter sp.]|nr:MATE family efflux transporter [Papillibacter sp.]